MKRYFLYSVLLELAFLVVLPAYSCGAYLFAHMKDADYGALYYSLSGR